MNAPQPSHRVVVRAPSGDRIVQSCAAHSPEDAEVIRAAFVAAGQVATIEPIAAAPEALRAVA